LSQFDIFACGETGTDDGVGTVSALELGTEDGCGSSFQFLGVFGDEKGIHQVGVQVEGIVPSCVFSLSFQVGGTGFSSFCHLVEFIRISEVFLEAITPAHQTAYAIYGNGLNLLSFS